MQPGSKSMMTSEPWRYDTGPNDVVSSFVLSFGTLFKKYQLCVCVCFWFLWFPIKSLHSERSSNVPSACTVLKCNTVIPLTTSLSEKPVNFTISVKELCFLKEGFTSVVAAAAQHEEEKQALHVLQHPYMSGLKLKLANHVIRFGFTHNCHHTDILPV